MSGPSIIIEVADLGNLFVAGYLMHRTSYMHNMQQVGTGNVAILVGAAGGSSPSPSRFVFTGFGAVTGFPLPWTNFLRVMNGDCGRINCRSGDEEQTCKQLVQSMDSHKSQAIYSR